MKQRERARVPDQTASPSQTSNAATKQHRPQHRNTAPVAAGPESGTAQVKAHTKARVKGLTAVGYLAPPIGRRTQWAIVVPRCVSCGFLHIHRSTSGDVARQRTGSCGAVYRIVIAGGKRGRWSA